MRVKGLTVLLLFFILPFSYASDVLNVGITGNNPPFSAIADENHFYGFDLEIMDEIGKRLNRPVNYVVMPFNQFFSAIDVKEIDLAIDSIIITSERQENYLFSLPYLASKVQFLTNANSPLDSTKDLMNKTIGVRQAEQFKAIFELRFNDQIKINVYYQMPEVFNALSTKKVDAIIINSVTANYLYANNSNQYKLIGQPIPLGLGFGIMARRGEDDLIASVNKALQDMEADGTYLKIYNEYFN